MSIGSIGSTTATTAIADAEKAQLVRDATKIAADNRAQAADRIQKADELARAKDQQTTRSSSKLGTLVDMYL
jgi:hypothetical protein